VMATLTPQNGRDDDGDAKIRRKALGLRVLRYGNDACRSTLDLMSSLIQLDWRRDLFTLDEIRAIAEAAERNEQSYQQTEREWARNSYIEVALVQWR